MVYPKLEEIMRQKGVSITDLIGATGMTRTSFWEKSVGKRDFKLAEAIQIKDFLKVRMPVEVLFERKE
jgi:hypothetical protein